MRALRRQHSKYWPSAPISRSLYIHVRAPRCLWPFALCALHWGTGKTHRIGKTPASHPPCVLAESLGRFLFSTRARYSLLSPTLLNPSCYQFSLLCPDPLSSWLQRIPGTSSARACQVHSLIQILLKRLDSAMREVHDEARPLCTVRRAEGQIPNFGHLFPKVFCAQRLNWFPAKPKEEFACLGKTPT